VSFLPENKKYVDSFEVKDRTFVVFSREEGKTSVTENYFSFNAVKIVEVVR